MENIQEEEAKNPTTENMPETQVYWIGMARIENTDPWTIAGTMSKNKQNIIDYLQKYWHEYREKKLISIELPI